MARRTRALCRALRNWRFRGQIRITIQSPGEKGSRPQGSAEKLKALRIGHVRVIKLLKAEKEQSKRAGVAYFHQLRWKDLRIHRCGAKSSENFVSVLTANWF